MQNRLDQSQGLQRKGPSAIKGNVNMPMDMGDDSLYFSMLKEKIVKAKKQPNCSNSKQ
jgi:hypothetical protein